MMDERVCYPERPTLGIFYELLHRLRARTNKLLANYSQSEGSIERVRARARDLNVAAARRYTLPRLAGK